MLISLFVLFVNVYVNCLFICIIYYTEAVYLYCLLMCMLSSLFVHLFAQFTLYVTVYLYVNGLFIV